MPVRQRLRRILADALEPYTHSSFNLLDYLGNCTDTALLLCIATARLSLLALMWFSRVVAPVLFRAPGNSFVFDTGEALYDDARFSMVRNWDGVHMFFIAHYGYLYESQIVFFPGLPAIIRAVELVTHRYVPLLHAVAPVSLYVCLINVTASCLAGVVLRRLTLLTLLGPEAVQATCRWRTPRGGGGGVTSAVARDAVATTTDAPLSVTEASTLYRVLCRMTGTALDAPDIRAPPPCTVAAAKTLMRLRRRVCGAAALVWVLTPAMVFTVAVYTESLFALTTILGVYLLAWYEPLPPAVQDRVKVCVMEADTQSLPLAAPTTSLLQEWSAAPQDSGAASRPATTSRHRIPGIVSLVRSLPELSGPTSITVRWQQRFVGRDEALAVLLFTVAGTLRSNAFTYVGFLFFPLCVQLALPAVYAAQASCVLAGASARRVLAAAGGAAHSSRSRSGGVRADIAVHCPTLRPPHQRLPHPLRVCVVLVESAVILAPYMTMNFIGYRRFVLQMWSAAEAARLGGAFWKMYPALQKKYWGVSLFSAYTFTNLPNVVLALPVAVFTLHCTYTYYLKPAWRHGRAAAVTAEGQRRSAWPCICDAVMPLVRSSNVVHLLALLTLALTAMHVQVTNRFVIASPALSWLLGAQLASRPTHLMSQLILVWSIVWIIAGGVLFPNHLPWT